MASKFLRTTDLARAVGLHPNTVRRYVQRGFLPPVERSPAGYRRFTERHLDFDLGTLDRGVGDRYSLGQALDRMITISDNASAIMLTDRVGAWRANESMQALGLRNTFVLAERLTTSPRDMLLFFEALATGLPVGLVLDGADDVEAAGRIGGRRAREELQRFQQARRQLPHVHAQAADGN